MKAILLKPIDGLEVGETYDIPDSWSHESGYERGETSINVRIQRTKTRILDWTCYSLEEFFEYWFVLQVLPETIIQKIENHLNIALKKYGLDIENEGHYGPLLATRRNERIDAVMSAVKDLLQGGKE